MKIFVRETLASPGQKKRSTLSGKSILKKIRNRRKAKKDRRSSTTNNDVLVELSTRLERRISRERRNKGQIVKDFVTISKMLFNSGLTFLVPYR